MMGDSGLVLLVVMGGSGGWMLWVGRRLVG